MPEIPAPQQEIMKVIVAPEGSAKAEIVTIKNENPLVSAMGVYAATILGKDYYSPNQPAEEDRELALADLIARSHYGYAAGIASATVGERLRDNRFDVKFPFKTTTTGWFPEMGGEEAFQKLILPEGKDLVAFIAASQGRYSRHEIKQLENFALHGEFSAHTIYLMDEWLRNLLGQYRTKLATDPNAMSYRTETYDLIQTHSSEVGIQHEIKKVGNDLKGIDTTYILPIGRSTETGFNITPSSLRDREALALKARELALCLTDPLVYTILNDPRVRSSIARAKY